MLIKFIKKNNCNKLLIYCLKLIIDEKKFYKKVLLVYLIIVNKNKFYIFIYILKICDMYNVQKYMNDIKILNYYYKKKILLLLIEK